MCFLNNEGIPFAATPEATGEATPAADSPNRPMTADNGPPNPSRPPHTRTPSSTPAALSKTASASRRAVGLPRQAFHSPPPRKNPGCCWRRWRAARRRGVPGNAPWRSTRRAAAPARGCTGRSTGCASKARPLPHPPRGAIWSASRSRRRRWCLARLASLPLDHRPAAGVPDAGSLVRCAVCRASVFHGDG